MVTKAYNPSGQEFARQADRLRHIQEIYAQYLGVKRDLFLRLEVLSEKGWPDRRAEIRDAFELQILYLERDSLRMADLVSRRDETLGLAHSLSDVCSRVESTWSEREDSELASRNSKYQHVDNSIRRLCAKCRDGMKGPLADMERDPEYARARNDARANIDRMLQLRWD